MTLNVNYDIISNTDCQISIDSQILYIQFGVGNQNWTKSTKLIVIYQILDSSSWYLLNYCTTNQVF